MGNISFIQPCFDEKAVALPTLFIRYCSLLTLRSGDKNQSNLTLLILCQFEIGVNEAVIDAEIGSAKFNGYYYDGVMPVLGCPNCNHETMEYTQD